MRQVWVRIHTVLSVAWLDWRLWIAPRLGPPRVSTRRRMHEPGRPEPPRSLLRPLMRTYPNRLRTQTLISSSASAQPGLFLCRQCFRPPARPADHQRKTHTAAAHTIATEIYRLGPSKYIVSIQYQPARYVGSFTLASEYTKMGHFYPYSSLLNLSTRIGQILSTLVLYYSPAIASRPPA